MKKIDFYGPRLPKVVMIAGPTASGKTGLAVELAKRFDGEVVSADSMQIYRQMRIGTARPTPEEMQGVPHHLMDFIPPDGEYSVAAYLEDAVRAVDDVLSRQKLPIVCGGTGQYLHALLNNLQFGGSGADPALRAALKQRLETEGAEALYAQLRQLDAAAAESIHPNNHVRLVRALELALSGTTKTKNNLESRGEPRYDFCVLGLNYADRSVLHGRIGLRVDAMLAEGLVEEALALRDRYGVTARAAIGYKELEPYFDGTASLEECAERIKTVTRNYAKRQLTWLRALPQVNWLYADRCDLLKTAANFLQICGV
ncbi:MAG: tRNA (adenosine(37)-N6)-dimethylallyltransferase MiaA [Clostridia bacterium]|nr:tRNA (adenosine(37)-N6)-dimethylallyltransferase MiaA [Clostridia bacterium]